MSMQVHEGQSEEHTSKVDNFYDEPICSELVGRFRRAKRALVEHFQGTYFLT